MKNYIYCTTTAKGEQTFYLMVQGTKYFLFAQEFRRSNKDVFQTGISLFALKRLKKHHSFSVRHTAEKLPAYIRYVEQEYGVCITEKTKRKLSNRQNKKCLMEKILSIGMCREGKGYKWVSCQEKIVYRKA